jgi:hypothetical protein
MNRLLISPRTLLLNTSLLPKVLVALIKALQPLRERVFHSLLDLLPVSLVEHCSNNVFDPHRPHPTLALLLLRGPVMLNRGRVIAAPPGGIPQGVTHPVYTFLTQHLQEAGDARLLYLCEGL